MLWQTILFLTLSINFCFSQTKKEENLIFPVFNLSELAPFEPGKNLKNIPKKYGIGNEVLIEKALSIKKYELKHEAYVFPIWVQYFNGVIIDFFTRPPSYFLHDTFHQSLINRYGKQNVYKLKDSTAVYIWENESIKRVYSGGCTITCYPIYYAATSKLPGQIPTTYKPLTEHFYSKNY